MPESALVIDAIGPDAKASLIDWYCSLQLREYRRIFRATDEAGQLDNVSRRFAWFRRILKIHEDEHAPAFLDHWHAERWLLRKFADVTKEDLRGALIREQSRLNVATLMEALNSTLEFEATMARKYNVPFEELIAPPAASINSGSQAQHSSYSNGQPITIKCWWGEDLVKVKVQSDISFAALREKLQERFKAREEIQTRLQPFIGGDNLLTRGQPH